MKAPARATIAMVGGAAALAVTVGLGAAGVAPAGSASPTTQSSVAPPPAHQSGIHAATLTGCIAGENC